MSYFKKIFISHLDRSLYKFVEKGLVDLERTYKTFSTRFHAYFRMQSSIQESLPKFYTYPYFSQSGKEEQDAYIHLFSLLKLWQQNQKIRALKEGDVARVIRRETNYEKVTELLFNYKNKLNDDLFEISRGLKEETDLSVERENLLGLLRSYRVEVKSLLALAAKYRDFYLCTHPNPYVRTRWGFAEWLTGPEPYETTQLKDLIFEIDNIDENFENLQKSLRRKKSDVDTQSHRINELLAEIRDSGHSLEVMRHKQGHLLDEIEKLDELGADSMQLVYMIDIFFYKIFRADWQYLSIFNFPKFNKLYAIHKSLMPKTRNQTYTDRIASIKGLISSMSVWVRRREAHSLLELESDKKNISEQLQNFIKEIEDGSQDELAEIIHHAFSLRYLFAEFFYLLGREKVDSHWLRSQCLFIDQLLDTIDRKIALFQTQN